MLGFGCLNEALLLLIGIDLEKKIILQSSDIAMHLTIGQEHFA